MASLFDVEDEVFAKFAFYAGAVLLKTTLMSLWTVRHRIPKNVFANPEDYASRGLKPTITSDPDVERVRRCHQNDLENVLPFVLIGSLYVMTKPGLGTASFLFRLFAGSRFIHTILYLNAVRRPWRGVAFLVGLSVNIYMVVSVMWAASC